MIDSSVNFFSKHKKFPDIDGLQTQIKNDLKGELGHERS
jgi:hypothetical protein